VCCNSSTHVQLEKRMLSDQLISVAVVYNPLETCRPKTVATTTYMEGGILERSCKDLTAGFFVSYVSSDDDDEELVILCVGAAPRRCFNVFVLAI
jgi:hypothetical protein